MKDDLPPPSAALILFAVAIATYASFLTKAARVAFLDRFEVIFDKLAKVSDGRPIRDPAGHALAMKEFAGARRWWTRVRPIINRAAK